MSEMETAAFANADLQATHQIIQFLEEAKAQSELILDSLAGFLLILDSKGTIYRCNRNVTNYLQIPFEDEVGFRFDQKIGSDKWKILAERMRQAKQTVGVDVVFEMEIRGFEGSRRSFQWSVRPVEGEISKAVSLDLFILTGHDLTEVKALTAEKSRMQQELLTAQTVQENLFAEPDLRMPGFSISGFYQSASECGGDWWYYNQIDSKVYLWIGDVTGHGVGAALVTSAARAAVSAIETMSDVTPAKALQFLNRAVHAASKGSKIMTFFVAAVDLETGLCTFANAGHSMPAIMQAQQDPQSSKREIEFLWSPPSFILGQFEDGQFEEGQIQLEEGDCLFLYTDGVIELENSSREQWGERSARRALVRSSNGAKDIFQIMKNFKVELEAHRDGADLVDDVTFFFFEMGKIGSK
jgi:serine phosphatase RsbU (regulator of sigma subunit)